MPLPLRFAVWQWLRATKRTGFVWLSSRIVVHLTVLTPDLGEGEDELELTYEGEGIEIGFNAAYLLEVLKYMSTDEVKITLKAPEPSRDDRASPSRG